MQNSAEQAMMQQGNPLSQVNELEDELFGIWKNRNDINDVNEHIRNIRGSSNKPSEIGRK